MKREIKLDGGEILVLKTLGLSGTPMFGKMLADRLEDLETAEFLDTLNGMISLGYLLSNKVNLRLIEGVLAQRPNIRLLSAIAPGLGLELARTHRPVLILLDINLPDMDGYAVMQCLREHAATRDIPVVGISANAMPQDLERGKAAGFAAYLTKPLDIDRLLQVVDGITAGIDRSGH